MTPLATQLHCTILNTSKRRPATNEHATQKKGGRRRQDRGRVAFDARPLLDLSPEEQDLGEVEIKEIQLCAMSTFDDTGAYRCLDSIRLEDLRDESLARAEEG